MTEDVFVLNDHRSYAPRMPEMNIGTTGYHVELVPNIPSRDFRRTRKSQYYVFPRLLHPLPESPPTECLQRLGPHRQSIDCAEGQ
jgi:hypothetical protein